MLQVNVANHCLNLVILECAGLSLLTDAGFIVRVVICVFGSVRSSRNANLRPFFRAVLICLKLSISIFWHEIHHDDLMMTYLGPLS